MTRSSANYLVYSCAACSKRIFTERSHRGRTGTCPCCGGKHIVGGARVALEAEERRRSPRVSGLDRGAQVEVVDQDALFPLRDLSETGVSFLTADQAEAAVGEVLEVTLQAPGAAEGRVYRAEIRRVEPGDGAWIVGAMFLDLDPEQRADLRSIVADLAD